MLITPTVAPHLLHFRSKSAPRVSATMQRRNRLHDSLPSKPIAEGDAKSAGCRGGVAARWIGRDGMRVAGVLSRFSVENESGELRERSPVIGKQEVAQINRAA